VIASPRRQPQRVSIFNHAGSVASVEFVVDDGVVFEVGLSVIDAGENLGKMRARVPHIGRPRIQLIARARSLRNTAAGSLSVF